ncbi:MAG: hypothetical protein ACT4PX_03420 [Actinomycetota bacterium]
MPDTITEEAQRHLEERLIDAGIERITAKVDEIMGRVEAVADALGLTL